MGFDEKTSVIDRRKMAASLGGEQEPRSACFIVIAGSQIGELYKLEMKEMIIGRVPEAGVRIEDDGVSRRHAKVTHTGDRVVLVDLSSTNGTFVNGEKIDMCELSDGDKIQIGTTTILKFSLQDSLEEDFQRRQYESATRDSLTGCYNKKYFLERLPSEFAFAVRHKKMLSVAMIDIDHFKKTNDTFGHLAGDHILRAVAEIIQDGIRADDVLTRYGGEEFALIMRETPPRNAIAAVERIRRSIELASLEFEGKAIPTTVSIGVATWDGDPKSFEELVQAADDLLYQAKEGGRNRTCGQS